jgi:hypothetical protein
MNGITGNGYRNKCVINFPLFLFVSDREGRGQGYFTQIKTGFEKNGK